MAEVRSLNRKITAQRADDGAHEVFIFGVIGDPWAFDVPSFLQWVAYTNPTTIRFVVMSPGGFAFDALNAVDFIKSKGITCYVEIVGECMSAATFFAAIAGPERTEITESGSFGIHSASGPIGDREFTAHVDERMRKLYSEAYGWTTAKLDKYLEGTGTLWLGQEAVDAGICSAIMDQKKVAARNISIDQFKKAQPIAMSDKKITVKGKLKDRLAASAAIVTNAEVEVEIDATEEQATASDELAKATADRIAAETAKSEADAAVEAAKQREADLTTKLADEAAKVTNLTTELGTVKAQHEGVKAELDTLKTNPKVMAALEAPIAAPVSGAGKEKEVVGGAPGAGKKVSAENSILGEILGGMTETERQQLAINKAKRKAEA